eukprot:6445736-Amphidinium_carterae.1
MLPCGGSVVPNTFRIAKLFVAMGSALFFTRFGFAAPMPRSDAATTASLTDTNVIMQRLPGRLEHSRP